MNYYTLGDFPGAYAADASTNWWKMSNDVRSVGSLLTWGVLFITQALSMAGILNDVNVMAWMYLIPFWMIMNMLSEMVSFWGRETAFSYYGDDATKVVAIATADAHKGEMLVWCATASATMLNLWINHEAWWKGQIKMMDEETREKFMMEGDDDEEMMFRKFYIGF